MWFKPLHGLCLAVLFVYCVFCCFLLDFILLWRMSRLVVSINIHGCGRTRFRGKRKERSVGLCAKWREGVDRMRRNEDKKEGGLLLLRMQKIRMAHGIGCDAQFNSIGLVLGQVKSHGMS